MTPEGCGGRRTAMYDVDDWGDQGIGALRACGRARNRPEIACTPWAGADWNASTEPATRAAQTTRHPKQRVAAFPSRGDPGGRQPAGHRRTHAATPDNRHAKEPQCDQDPYDCYWPC
ncbi:hypothetical protein GCM10020295_28650 [Streptomyces cinereospinus]